MSDRTFYFYTTRKQIIVVWYDTTDGKQTSHHARTERGEAAATRKMQRLQTAGYTRVDAPRDWFADLLASVKEARS